MHSSSGSMVEVELDPWYEAQTIANGGTMFYLTSRMACSGSANTRHMMSAQY
jgi:hypothetical protein